MSLFSKVPFWTFLAEHEDKKGCSHIDMLKILTL